MHVSSALPNEWEIFLDNFALPDYGKRAAAAVRESPTENLELQQRFNLSAVLCAAMQGGRFNRIDILHI